MRGEHTIEEVCKSSFLSYRYNFGAAEWSKETYIDDDGLKYFLDHEYFDPKSIM